MNWKKLFLISVLLLSTLSVAFAQEVGAEKGGYISKEIQEKYRPGLSGEGSGSKINRKNKEEIMAARKNLGEARVNLREKIQEVKEVRKEIVGEVRESVKEEVVSPERAKKAREDYLKRKEAHKDQRAKLEDFKEKLSECKAGKVPKEECRGLGKLVVNQGRELLKSSRDKIEGLLDQTKQKVLNSNLPEEKKTELINKLNERLEKLAKPSTKESEDASKEEINAKAKELRTVWKEAKTDIQASAGRMAAEKMGGVLQKTQSLREKLARTLSALKEKSKSTSELERELANFEAKLENARKTHSEAVRLLEERNPENMKKATELIRAAHKELKEAHALLRNLVKNMKEAGEDNE